MFYLILTIIENAILLYAKILLNIKMQSIYM